MKILVAGGTGFIGSRVVEEALKNRNIEVSVLTREPQKAKKLFLSQVTPVRGDVTEPFTLKKTLVGIDVIVQCVQFPNHPVQNPKRGHTYEKVDAKGTENICNAAKDSSVQRIVYISGAGTREGRVEPWFKAKIRAENAVKNYGKDFVILRPSWVYGPRDKSLNKFVQFAKTLPMMPVIGQGEYRASPLFVDDLAKICVKALSSESAKNKTIEVGGPQVLSMNEIEKTVMQALGKSKLLVHQPLWAMKFVAGILEKLLSTPPLSREAIDFITTDMPVDHRLAEQIFEMKMTPLKEALGQYLKK